MPKKGRTKKLAGTYRTHPVDTLAPEAAGARDADAPVARPAAEEHRETLADLAPELAAMLRAVLGLPALWGSAAARPTVERARELLKRAEGAA